MMIAKYGNHLFCSAARRLPWKGAATSPVMDVCDRRFSVLRQAVLAVERRCSR